MLIEVREDKLDYIVNKVSNYYLSKKTNNDFSYLKRFKERNLREDYIREAEPFKTNPNYLYIEAMYNILRNNESVIGFKYDENEYIIDIELE